MYDVWLAMPSGASKDVTESNFVQSIYKSRSKGIENLRVPLNAGMETKIGSRFWSTNTCLPQRQFSAFPAIQCSGEYVLHKNVTTYRCKSTYCRRLTTCGISPANKSSVDVVHSLKSNLKNGFAHVTALGMPLIKLQRIVGILALSTIFNGSVPHSADAARSGGRMGGMRSFSSAYSSSAASSMYRSSLSSGTSSRMGTTIGGPHRSSVQTNAFFFSPFGFGFGYGYPMGGGGLMSLLFWGVFAAIIVQVLRGSLSGDNDDDRQGYIGGGSYGKLSVAKVQVGLLSNARALQRDLERIASRADTSTPRGLHYVLQETVLALMRNPDYCVYGFAKSGIEDSPEAAEARFNKLSLEERGKFQKETRVNVGGIVNKSTLGGSSSLASSVGELIVVTILVAAEGKVRLPKANSRSQLKDALSTLGSIPAEDIYAVEVLWTPEEEGDYFTTEDLAYDYPMLNTL